MPIPELHTIRNAALAPTLAASGAHAQRARDEFVFMLLGVAIPVLGAVKIICDHVEPLQPLGSWLGT